MRDEEGEGGEQGEGDGDLRNGLAAYKATVQAMGDGEALKTSLDLRNSELQANDQELAILRAKAAALK